DALQRNAVDADLLQGGEHLRSSPLAVGKAFGGLHFLPLAIGLIPKTAFTGTSQQQALPLGGFAPQELQHRRRVSAGQPFRLRHRRPPPAPPTLPRTPCPPPSRPPPGPPCRPSPPADLAARLTSPRSRPFPIANPLAPLVAAIIARTHTLLLTLVKLV